MIIFMLSYCFIIIHCHCNDKFIMCSDKAFLNTEVLSARTSVETVMVSSEIQCGRKCNRKTDCIGMNVARDNGGQLRCDIVSSTDPSLDPCSSTETHDTMVFYVKETYEECKEGFGEKIVETEPDDAHEKGFGEKIMETVGLNNVVFGSFDNVRAKLEDGENIRILLINFQDKHDFLVQVDTARVYQSSVCAQSVHNFELNNDFHMLRMLLLICTSGKVEVQSWRVWANLVEHSAVYTNLTTIWFTDGRPRTHVISVKGEGNVRAFRNDLLTGQVVSMYQKATGGFARIISSSYVNLSYIALKHPWEYRTSVSNGITSIHSDLRWMSKVFSNPDYVFLSQWYMESDVFIEQAIRHNSLSFMLDKSWITINVSQVTKYLNEGHLLRVVFENRAETVGLLRLNASSGEFVCGVDRVLQTTDQTHVDSTLTQVYTMLASTGERMEYTFLAGNYSHINVGTKTVHIDWAMDTLSWNTLSQGNYGSSLVTGLLNAALDRAKRIRVKISIESYEYYFTADNILRDGGVLMASYFGFGFDFEMDSGKTWLLRVWSNGTVFINEQMNSSGGTESVYYDVKMWWFIN